MILINVKSYHFWFSSARHVSTEATSSPVQGAVVAAGSVDKVVATSRSVWGPVVATAESTWRERVGRTAEFFILYNPTGFI